MKSPKILLSVLFVLLVLLFLSLLPTAPLTSAQDCPTGNQELYEICMELNKSREALQMSIDATKPLEVTLTDLENRINNLQKQIDAAQAKAEKLEKDIFEREVNLGVQKELMFRRIRSLYKRQHHYSPFLVLLSSQNAVTLTRELFFKETVANKDKEIISQIATEISKLSSDKKQLEQDKISLAALQKEIDSQAAFFRKEIKGAKAYQASLTQKIAELTARQQAILTEKAGTFQTTVGDVPLADDPNARPDFNPGFSPAFAAFSFGAPHFKGLSQYGAFGRAKEGQNYQDILRVYYGDVRIETVDTNFLLPTTVGSLPFEDNYLKGIAEMPTQWADEGGWEALKAQAVAARSYALAYTGWRLSDRTPKSAICITENCQVYHAAKALNPGRWADAVNETRGQILVSNQSHEVVNAWYASTSGGYQESYSSLGHSTPAFWDTKNGRDGWTSQAYEKIANSPWFYKGWYKTRSGDTCGRSHPWLNLEEMADILNAWVVLQHSSDDRVSPLGGCWGGNPYSLAELREKANNSGGAITEILSISVEYSELGFTANVFFDTNRGRITISGSEFKNIFNLRAPGRISLKSGLFNLEKK